MPSQPNPCAVLGCQVSAKPGQLMCKGHWYDTPANLRVAVNRAWRNFRNDREAYFQARQAAVMHHVDNSAPEAQAEMF